MTDKPKRQYHKSSVRKAKEAADRATRQAKKKLEVAEKKLERERVKVRAAKKKINKKSETANKLADIISGKSKTNLITEDEIDSVGPVLQEIAKDEENIIFKPNDGPQTEFLASTEMEVLYGGAAGGGKSYAMLVDPLRYMHNKNHRALLIRRTLGELSELIDKSQYLYKAAFPGATYVSGKSRWDFPSGAKLYFGYCDTDQDVMRYIGQAYSWIGVDELTHFATPYVWETLRSRLRTTDPDIIPYMRACVDEGDVLTENGWKPIQNVKKNEYVYGLTKDGEIVKRKVHTAVVYDVNEELIRVKKKNLYMSMTQDHKVVYKINPNENKFNIIKWNKHTNKSINIARTSEKYTPINTYISPLDNFSTDEFCTFLGLYIAEGSINWKPKKGNYKILITQLKKENHKFIRSTMEAGGYNVCYSKNGDFQITNKKLREYCKQFGKSHQKHFPRDFLDSANREQLKLAFDAYALGDGHWQSNTSCTLVTCSKQLADDIQEIAIKLGYKTQLKHIILPNPNHNDRYDVYITINKISTTQVDKGNIRNNTELVPYVGKVYCIGVEEIESFFLRQKGFVWCSSNTTNPGGIGGWWVKKMFVDPAGYNKAFWATDIDTGTTLIFPDSEFVPEEVRGKPLFKRRFIPAKLTDNPYLMQSTEYMAKLASMSEVQRRRLLEGDWDIAEDIAFPEFDRNKHVVPYEEPPKFWRRFRACDYGFVAGTAVLWFAVSPNKEVYVYRELYEKGLDAETLAERIIELEWDEPPNITGMLDHDSWARRGQMGPTNAEIMIKKGVRWLKADKGPNSRLNGKNLIHQYLRSNPVTNKPTLYFMDNCVETIKTITMIPLKVEKSTQTITEDVDTNYPDDHLYDALRYGLTSRFVVESLLPQEKAWRRQRRKYSPSDKNFGY